MITVKFFNQWGRELSTRQFQPSERIAVNVFVQTGGIPSTFTHVSCDVFAGAQLLFSQQDTTNLWGLADFQFQIPDNVRSGSGKVIINTTNPIFPNDQKTIPIAFGNSNPSELPEATDWLTQIRNNILIIAAIGVGAWLIVKKKLL